MLKFIFVAISHNFVGVIGYHELKIELDLSEIVFGLGGLSIVFSGLLDSFLQVTFGVSV